MPEVTVAPAGFTGRADYYCTGTYDETVILQAVEYLYAAYGGGSVRLLGGTFVLGAQTVVIPRSNILLKGVGYDTYIMSNNTTAILGFAPSTGTLSNCGIQDIRFGSLGLSFLNVQNSYIERCWLSAGQGISMQGGCNDNRVSGNIIDGELVANAAAGVNLFVAPGEATNNRNIISSNIIKNLRAAAGSPIAIYVADTDCLDTLVVGNYCYNNGSDTDIANTNTHNFRDAGTDTQVYSNPWQSPVAGEPSVGELHPLATGQSAWLVDGVSATAAVTSVSCGALVPVGAKAVDAFVQMNNAYIFLMVAANTTVTCTTNFNNAAMYLNFGISYGARIPITLDSNRRFYFRSWDGGAGVGAVGSYVNIGLFGYYS